MTITYDPHHDAYRDESDVRGELTRAFDICQGCRKCTDLCSSFPTLFQLVDRHHDHDAGRLTPAQQDEVIAGCHQCTLCALNCPYTPDLHELALDFPRLMLRARAMRLENGQVSVRSRMTNGVVGRPDRIGKVATRVAPAANRIATAKEGSLVRKAVEVVTGVSSVRLLPPFARQRFSTWFHTRPKVRLARRQGRVAIFPSCLVEYQQPQVGHDLVKVYERNSIECTLAEGVGCCGAPWLHSGDVDKFTKVAAKNVKVLAAIARKGKDIVVPQPTCGLVLKQDYATYVNSDDARLVAASTYDAAEYLMKIHHGAGTRLDTEFEGTVPRTVAYHTPCHLKSQNAGLKSRDLIKLTGAKVNLVQQCSGMSAAWGIRAENVAISVPIAEALGEAIRTANGDVVTGDCHTANTAIAEQTGEPPLHPLQLIARAYGIAEEDERR